MTYLCKAILIFTFVIKILNALDCHVCDGNLSLGPPRVQNGMEKMIKNVEKQVKDILPALDKHPQKGNTIVDLFVIMDSYSEPSVYSSLYLSCNSGMNFSSGNFAADFIIKRIQCIGVNNEWIKFISINFYCVISTLLV